MVVFTLAAAALLTAGAAQAHEFWIEPVIFMPKVNERVPVTYRIGMNFVGESYPYVKAWFRRFAVIDAAGERPVKGTEGDDPAAELRFAKPGLATLVYHSNPDPTSFSTMAEFESYLKDEGLEWIAAKHRERGLPETKIRETYVRCAKALVRVGNGGGSDRAIGLPLELIAERSPYELGADKTLPVLLLHNGQPLAGATIKAFNTDNPKTHRRFVTDAEGRARIPLPVKDRYLLNAVHMLPAAAGDNAEWSSLWASLTFLRP